MGNINVTVIPIKISGLGTLPKGKEKKLEELENQGKNRGHITPSIVEINLNTEKNP